MKRINDGSKVLVFGETKKGVDELTKMMRQDGWHGVKGIHGDKTQFVITHSRLIVIGA
jgi:ATP-dependent RNA helicase DDX5/DBP2